jgi:porin
VGRAPRRVSRWVVVALIAATTVASGASATDDEELPYGQAEQTSSDEQEAAASNPDETPAQADGMGGPSSVGAQLVRDGRHRKYEQLQKPKEWLQENYALSIGADYNLLAQQVSEGPGPTDGVGGVLRFYGSWALVNRGAAEDTGSFVFKVEYRHSLGTELPAASVLPTAGAAGISGPTFGDNGGVLTNLYWTQSFADNRFAFEVGVVDTTDYLDVYGLVNPWADFNNLAFSTSPAIAVPNQGLGAAALFMVTPRWYVLGGLADADADPHRPQDFFSSFAEGEYFTHVEFGRVGSWDTRYSDNIHLLLWRVDDRVEAGVDGGWGATVSWGFEYGGRWLPFVRGGWSDGGGTVVDRTASAGVGYRINQHDDYFGFAANWGRAPDNPRNQYQLEAYYRTHISPGLSVAPSAQVVLHPADNPEISSLWLIAVRLRAVW